MAYLVSDLQLRIMYPLPRCFVALTPIDDSDDATVPATYIVLDTAGKVFTTVLCTHADDQSWKVFLVNELDAECGHVHKSYSSLYHGRVTTGPFIFILYVSVLENLCFIF